MIENNKKTDLNSLIGFILIGAIMMWWIYSQPTKEPVADTANVEEVESTKVQQPQLQDNAALPEDPQALESQIGAFYYSATLPSATDAYTTIENDLVRIKVANKGGMPAEVELKEYTTYGKDPLYIIKDGNADFNLKLATRDNRLINTSDLYFEPSLSKEGENQVLSMKLKVSETQFLEYIYVLKPSDYMLDYSLRTTGMSQVINTAQPVALDWKLTSFHTEKSWDNENRYSMLSYSHEDEKVSELSITKDDEESSVDVEWFAFKQQFFATILLADGSFEEAKLLSHTHEENDPNYIKDFEAVVPLDFQGGELNKDMQLYFGPNHFNTLKKYDSNIDELVPLGWGIFGWINRFFVIPTFDILYGKLGLSMGIVILVMTLLVKLVLSPITYKNFVSSAKMRVIRPEVDEINEKYKDADPMKRQQATMELYSKAGVNPMSGCLPALLQMPILIAMFRFFPAAIELRGQRFLWADDLSAYDSILDLGFNIPIYGDHISGFTLLMAASLLAYTKMSGQANTAPTQPGMPDMRFIMYLMPVMMIVWFNNYASGLSYYYFLSNLISVIQLWVIKNYIIDEDKIHAQIQENKKKPKKQSKWAQRMQDIAKQAQEQQKLQQQQQKGRKK